MMKSRGLVIILDGLGDRPCAQLDGQTPLEAAKTPTLDALAARHQSGMMDPLQPGFTVDTHTGVGILFGLSPTHAVALERGPIEAAGIGLSMQPGDVLWRANFATVEKTKEGFTILDRRAGRIREQVEELCADLQDLEVAPNIIASLHAATQHRAVLRLRGSGLSTHVSNTDPGGHAAERGVLASLPTRRAEQDSQDYAAARTTADALNHFTRRAHEILDPARSQPRARCAWATTSERGYRTQSWWLSSVTEFIGAIRSQGGCGGW